MPGFAIRGRPMVCRLSIGMARGAMLTDRFSVQINGDISNETGVMAWRCAPDDQSNHKDNDKADRDRCREKPVNPHRLIN